MFIVYITSICYKRILLKYCNIPILHQHICSIIPSEDESFPSCPLTAAVVVILATKCVFKVDFVVINVLDVLPRIRNIFNYFVCRIRVLFCYLLDIVLLCIEFLDNFTIISIFSINCNNYFITHDNYKKIKQLTVICNKQQ